ncbi:MAG TPA: multicopper oxidase domain-containing protein, partial [Gemmatimonadaceae bacterium]
VFHCEDPVHSEVRGAMGFGAPTYVAANGAVLTRGFGGLATVVEVSPAEGDTSWKLPPVPLPNPARRFRMLLRPNVGSTPTLPIYGIALTEAGQESPPPDSGQRVGPTLVLNRNEPVSVWVVNNLPEATAITWHGIEGESINDGFPGVSGVKPTPLPRNAPPPKEPPKPPYAPLIAPGDSFEVRLAPPRSGTFAYHAVVSETRQWAAGIVGAVVVTDRNKYDAALNLPLLISSPSDSVMESHAVLINGSTTPPEVDVKRGAAFRIRAMNFAVGRPDLVLEMRHQDSTFAAWRLVARDGIELPAAERVSLPARAMISNGQMRDFEFSTTRIGEYRLEVRTVSGTVLGVQPIRVY